MHIVLYSRRIVSLNLETSYYFYRLSKILSVHLSIIFDTYQILASSTNFNRVIVIYTKRLLSDFSSTIDEAIIDFLMAICIMISEYDWRKLTQHSMFITSSIYRHNTCLCCQIMLNNYAIRLSKRIHATFFWYFWQKKTWSYFSLSRQEKEKYTYYYVR
jgi:hypothetical protein